MIALALSFSGCPTKEPNTIELTRERILLVDASLTVFRLDHERYPTTEEGLNTLVVTPRATDRPGTTYLPTMDQIEDGWGRQLLYYSPGIHAMCEYENLSYGKDGRPGGKGENEDIISCGSRRGYEWLSGGW